MKTVIQIAAAYLQARAAADTAMADPARLDYEEFLRQSGRREAYADVLELDEATFTAPPAEIEPLERLSVIPSSVNAGYLLIIPREWNSAAVAYTVQEARELRDALNALDWSALGAEGQAGQ